MVYVVYVGNDKGYKIMITIYQIRLSDADINAVNASGWDAVPKASARADMMFGARKWNEEFTKYYEPTYEVDTDDLDQAFESTNLWEDFLVRRLARNSSLARGSSSSVGDIFVKDSDCYIVDNFGFVNIGKYELGA
jgi:hypothetical protein